MTLEEFYRDLLERQARYQRALDLFSLHDQVASALRSLDEGDAPRIEWDSDNVSVPVGPASVRPMLVAERTRIRSEITKLGIDPPVELEGGVIEEVTSNEPAPFAKE